MTKKELIRELKCASGLEEQREIVRRTGIEMWRKSSPLIKRKSVNKGEDRK